MAPEWIKKGQTCCSNASHTWQHLKKCLTDIFVMVTIKAFLSWISNANAAYCWVV